MQKKKFSRKINYDVLKNLFSNDTKEPKSSRKKDGWDTDSSDDLRAGNNRSSNAGERDYFASDQDDNLEIIEEDAGLPPSHPLVRKESRPRGKKSGKGSGTDGRGSGRESGYESQTGAPLTGGATATEGEDEEFGRAEEGDGHGQNYFEEEDYADDYADGGDYWD